MSYPLCSLCSHAWHGLDCTQEVRKGQRGSGSGVWYALCRCRGEVVGEAARPAARPRARTAAKPAPVRTR